MNHPAMLMSRLVRRLVVRVAFCGDVAGDDADDEHASEPTPGIANKVLASSILYLLTRFCGIDPIQCEAYTQMHKM